MGWVQLNLYLLTVKFEFHVIFTLKGLKGLLSSLTLTPTPTPTKCKTGWWEAGIDLWVIVCQPSHSLSTYAAKDGTFHLYFFQAMRIFQYLEKWTLPIHAAKTSF